MVSICCSGVSTLPSRSLNSSNIAQSTGFIADNGDEQDHEDENIDGKLYSV